LKNRNNFKHGGFSFVSLLAIISAATACPALESCRSEQDADAIARALADRLQDALKFDNSETKKGDAPQGHTSGADYPAVTMLDAPQTLYPGQSFEIGLPTDFAMTDAIAGAAVQVDKASHYIEVHESYDSVAGRVILHGHLADDKKLIGHIFHVRIALLDDLSRAGNYVTWDLAIVMQPDAFMEQESVREPENEPELHVFPDAYETEPSETSDQMETIEEGENLPDGMQLLAESGSQLESVVVDGSYVYYLEPGPNDQAGGRVMRVPVTGGTPEVIAKEQGNPLRIATDRQAVYWTTWLTGNVMRWTKSSGLTDVLAEGEKKPGDIVSYGGILFWANFGTGTIEQLSLSDMKQSTLYQTKNGPNGLAVFGSYLAFTIAESVQGDQHSGLIYVFSLATGGPRLVASKAGLPRSVALDEGRVYWLDELGPDGNVNAQNISGGNTMVLASKQNGPTWITADTDYLYYAVSPDRVIRRVSKKGGPPEDIAPAMDDFVLGMALDNNFVYWVTRNKLYKVKKP